jgi:hypothetical protein
VTETALPGTGDAGLFGAPARTGTQDLPDSIEEEQTMKHSTKTRGAAAPRGAAPARRRRGPTAWADPEPVERTFAGEWTYPERTE